MATIMAAMKSMKKKLHAQAQDQPLLDAVLEVLKGGHCHSCKVCPGSYMTSQLALPACIKSQHEAYRRLTA